MKRLLLFFLLFIGFQTVFAQTHEWAKSFNPNYVHHSNFKYSVVNGIDVDSSDNSYVVGGYSDSLYVDTFAVKANLINPISHNQSNNAFVSKIDKLGNIKWINSIHADSSHIRVTDVRIVTDNRIVVYGWVLNGVFSNITLKVKFSPNDSIISRGPTLLFIAIYDSLGSVVQYQKIVPSGGVSMGWHTSIHSNNTRFLEKDQDNNILLSFRTQGNSSSFYLYTKDDSIFVSLGGHYNQFVVKYTPNFDSIIWVKNISTTLPSSINHGLRVNTIRTGRDNNLYITANNIESSNPGMLGVSFTVDGSTFTMPKDILSKGFLIVLAPDGNFVHKGFVNQDLTQDDFLSSVDAIDTNRIYVTGVVLDSFRRGNSIHFVANPKQPDYGASSHTGFSFVGEISLNGIGWMRMTDKRILTAFGWSSTHYYHGGAVKLDRKGYIYTRILVAGNATITIGGLTSDSLKDYIASNYKSGVFGRFDPLGNALWLVPDVPILDMIPNSKNELIYCGEYDEQINLPPYVLSHSNTSSRSGFVAKMRHYAITRGDVFAGPYCAGDTFLVPYVQEGEYDTANWFVAELSDEEGNFEGGERELGRLKTTRDSTVIGQLPLFNVVSSGNYRIRIRSTHPPVQNYYRGDSLRLLIYSRDKADPGPPEYVCYGDSFKLSTYGGTAWQWSPAYKMDDSTSRTPMVLVDRDTVYQIIISDSSGCGDIDTAYKQVLLSLPPKIVFAKDTVEACINDLVKLYADFEGGDSNAYKYVWYNTQGPFGWFAAKGDSFFRSDTLFFVYSSAPQIRSFAVILEDGCSIIKDTALVHLKLPPSPTKDVDVSPLDTFICPQSQVVIRASFPDSIGYSWWWIEKSEDKSDTLSFSNSTESGEFDSLQVTPVFSGQNPKSYSLLSQNICSGKSDTTSIILTPREPLQAKILRKVFDGTDSSFEVILNQVNICQGTELFLNASGTGGDSSNYSFHWLLNDTQLGIGNTLNFKPSSVNNSTLNTHNLKLILNDGCMPENDTIEVLINVRPALSAAMVRGPHHDSPIQDTTVCSGSELEFFAKGFGGDSTNYSYEWYLDDSFFNSDPDIIVRFSNHDPNSTLSTHNLKLILSDNCSPRDTLIVTINVLPPLKSDFVAPDTVCSGEELELFAEPSGGKNTRYQYLWETTPDPSKGGEWKVLATDSSLIYAPTFEGLGWVRLILSDGCSSPNDTFEQEIYVRPALSLDLSPSSQCANPSSTLTAIPSGGNPNNYIIEWFDQDNTQISTGETLVVTPSELTTYKVILSDGCSEPNAEAQILIDLLPSTLTLLASPSEGCEPLEVEFTLNTNYSHAFSAKILIGSDSFNIQNSTLKTFSASTFTPTLTFSTQSGCSMLINGPEITVHPKPISDFTFVPEEPSLDKPKVNFKNLSSGAISYQWNLEPFGEFTDFEPEVSYQDSGRFSIRLIAFSDQGCSDTLEGELFVKSPERMFLPTAFSPNGDGLNDIFEPKVRGYEVAEFSIFNRWGEKIFSSQGTGWDGTYNGNPAQMGVYTYTLLLVDEKGEKLLFTGTVNLMR